MTDEVDRLQTLQLTSGYVPSKIVTWQRAIVLLYQSKVDVLESYEARVAAPSITLAVPAVIRLHKDKPRDKNGIKFSRSNVYARDRHQCCYCGGVFHPKTLEFDHVIPRSKWKGPIHKMTSWENIVTACKRCNRRKDNRTPAEAGMRMLYQPRIPRELPQAPLLVDLGSIPDVWRPYFGVVVSLASQQSA